MLPSSFNPCQVTDLGNLLSDDADSTFKGLVYRTALSDRYESGALCGIQVSLDCNLPNEYIRQWLACVSGMPYADTHTLQWPTLLSCVHAKRHGGAGAQPRAQQIVRGRPRSQPSDASRFVGKEMGRTGVDLHLEVPDTRLLDHDFTALAGSASGGALPTYRAAHAAMTSAAYSALGARVRRWLASSRDKKLFG